MGVARGSQKQFDPKFQKIKNTVEWQASRSSSKKASKKKAAKKSPMKRATYKTSAQAFNYEEGLYKKGHIEKIAIDQLPIVETKFSIFRQYPHDSVLVSAHVIEKKAHRPFGSSSSDGWTGSSTTVWSTVAVTIVAAAERYFLVPSFTDPLCMTYATITGTVRVW
jgi:hypothetical protein